MIKLTRMNGSKFTLNAELVMTIEECPDTVISLTTGQKLIVKDSEQEIIQKIIDYKKRITYISREVS